MLRVTDLVKGVNQGTFLVGHQCDVEVDHRLGGCVSEALPVRWNDIPGVLDQHLIPMCGGRREVGE